MCAAINRKLAIVLKRHPFTPDGFGIVVTVWFSFQPLQRFRLLAL
jgi:hypothetical protein